MNKDTSWGKVASWYDEYLSDSDSYQQQVILPNIQRIVDPQKGQRILDLACGQGFFAAHMAASGADIMGVDISSELVQTAKKKIRLPNVIFEVSSAHKLGFLKDASYDTVYSVLAAQNIKELDETFAECQRILKPGGRLVLVLNHPTFRVPQSSDWYFDEQGKRQGRVTYKYLSETQVKIDMYPGSEKKVFTYSFHRPLQVFIKWLTKRGFAITRLEEWTSHKKSQKGPRALAEDLARKEIPLFMCLEATQISHKN
ncbi:MAG: hypothetical protein RL094_672 [Candidatus Parcubacteria bacterium]|jgi:ubiquinone/menaquinone biosynthesis C-methylase UbiE